MASPAWAEEVEEYVIQLRTFDDPDQPPDLTFCATAPFNANVFLGASVFSVFSNPMNARIINEKTHKVGTGTACLLFDDFTFPVGSKVPFHATFDLEQGAIGGTGECTITSNDVPVDGIVLMGCVGDLSTVPDGFLGGIASSTTAINPFDIPGYTTGSFMTFRMFRLKPDWFPWMEVED
jgi:hypothetical protein